MVRTKLVSLAAVRTVERAARDGAGIGEVLWYKKRMSSALCLSVVR